VGSIHKLIIEDDEGKTTVVPVSRGEITIGRMEGNTIRLMERNVSRRHARLLRDSGAVFIEDLNSFNGVKINGERIDAKLEIKEGDLVEIGDYHLALQSVEVEEDTSSRAETAVPHKAPADAQPTMQSPQMPPAAHAGNGNANAWRMMATVPDFNAEDAMREARAEMDARGNSEASTTANMRPSPIGPVDPMVGPPPTKEHRSGQSLPPFPSASQGFGGGLAPALDAPFSGAGAGIAALRGRDDAALRTEQIQVGPPRVSDVPRLVCVSTEYAGKDFPINRPEVVIGRVEDNDVVIEHRSVSRNHAKVMFDGRVHKIIDLQSANGILVNGEEYAITDLRKNDLIELGHVKFRFIPAGEPFVPIEEEAKAMLDAGVTPPAMGGGGGLSPPARPIEPPTVPHKTQMELKNSFPAPHNHKTEDLIQPSDTVEMPVHVDASSAATVTDTPISVFGNDAVLQPKLEPPTDRPMHSRNDGERVERIERREAPSRRSDTTPDAPPSGPTIRAGGTAAAKIRSAPIDDDSDVRSGPGRKNRIMIALGVVGLLLAALVFAVAKLGSGGGGENYDQHLQELLKDGKVDEAQQYWREHTKQLTDPAGSLDAIEAVRNAKKTTPVPPTASPDPATPPPSPAASVVPEIVPEGEEPATPEGDPVEPSPTRPAVPPTKDKKPVGKPPAPDKGDPAKRVAEARQFLRDASSVMVYKPGAWAEAENLLRLCLQKADLPECHYQLGVVYANLDDTKQSLKHYRKFVELEPNSEKAPKVRAILKKFE